MGSRSDWPTLEHAAKVLDDLHISYKAEVVSAHRTPDRMFDYAATAEARGVRVIIAGAGGAAHLPGMVAAKTRLPALHCADARRHSRRHLRYRQLRRKERRPLRRRNPGPHGSTHR